MTPNPSMKQRPLLYVDDSANDHFFFQRAVRLTATPFLVQAFLSDDQVLAYLRGEPPFSDRQSCPFPDFLLCDYDLGLTTGAALIRAIRQIAGCSEICIIVFSGVIDDERMPLSYAAGADHFLCKPTDLRRLEVIVKTLWTCINSLPTCFEPITRLPEYEHCPQHDSKLVNA